MRWLLACALVLLAAPASAGLTEAELAAVRFEPSPGTQLPLGLPFRTAEGRQLTLAEALGGKPALLLPVDYECRTTCGPALSILAGALAETSLRPGEDFRLVLVGLNPHDNGENAHDFAEARIGGTALAQATVTLTGAEPALRALMDAIGYRYTYDRDSGAFAHPTGLVAATPEGRIARALSSLALNGTDLRLALLEAGRGRIGGVLGQLVLLCYGFDAVHGIYTAAIERILKIAGGLTVVLMALALGWLARRARPEESAP